MEETGERHIPCLRWGYSSLFDFLRDIPELVCGFNSSGESTICLKDAFEEQGYAKNVVGSWVTFEEVSDEWDETLIHPIDAPAFTEVVSEEIQADIKSRIVDIIKINRGGVSTKQLQGEKIFVICKFEHYSL